ncbi:MAG: GldG family protein [Clostridia bacterium]|nr:GldG family protein [Clostridia bacterium]
MKKNVNIIENEALETPVAEKAKKVKKAKKIKNQALLKRGGYAMAITAAVLAGIVVLNVLLGVLAKRVPLEFDMTLDKQNSIAAENIEYIKGIDKEVKITVCANENDYLMYMSNYAPQIYGVLDGDTAYYDQTLKLINKYDNYNSKIKIEFIDTQDTKFTEISTKYPQEQIGYGDIIVTCNDGTAERYKVVNFQDIYVLEEDQTYAAYGMSGYILKGNNIETALTSAIAYVTDSVDKKVAFITGHSKTDYSESYRALLKNNNYEIDLISETLITKISDDYNAIFIVAPTTDFLDSELDIISKFLDNGGKYGKGLVFFADAAAPYLPNLSAFLAEWGIEVREGIMFETNAQNHIADAPTSLGSYPNGDDEILNGIAGCITGYNVPIKPVFETKGVISTSQLIVTPDTVVNAPIGTSNSWTGADKYKKEAFATVLQSKRFNYDEDNNPIQNHVFALSSIEFIHGEWSETAAISNKNIAFKVAERAVGAEDTGISFIAKTIENQSFAAEVTELSRNIMFIVFVILLPLAMIAAGIYVYIRRKNS